MAPPETSPDLLAAQRGDRDALRRVVEAWWCRMRRWALIEAGDTPGAEDATQEALVRLVRHIGGWDPSRPFASWLRRLVRNACRDQHRGRAGRWHQAEELLHDLSSPRRADPDRALDLARVARRAIEGFEGLTPRQREVLVLVDLEGHTPSEAAAELGLSASAVRAHLTAARRGVRCQLADPSDQVLPLLRESS
jgi:RNA polymerase sigma factor (sigma-70 family)